MKRILKVLLGLVGVLILAALVWLYDPLPATPSAASLSKGMADYPVEIIRDQWGVPHIFGKTDADVSFGLAYAHAEDDYQTTQETIAATRGVLARYRGAKAAPTDYIVALMGIWKTVDSRYQQDVPDDVKAIATAYAEGLNLYAAHHPDKTWDGLAPFTAQDVVAGFMFKTPFFYSLDKSLLSYFDVERDLELALAPNAQQQALQVRPAQGGELGSNAMAVAAKRSGDATTRLLINSHQPMTGPVAWYEAHAVSEEGWNMLGGVFPGTPVILHGFSPNLGWANTVNHIDLVDSYVLTRNPNNELQYRLDDKWQDFAVEELTIKVKLFGPFHYPATRRVLRSVHGPVIEAGDNTIAIRYAGMDEIRQLEQYYRLNKSQNFAQFTQSMALNALPSINYIYADRADNIGFIHNAQYPARADGWDWSKDLPGDRSDLIWQGYRPYSEVPKLINPKSGLVFNANNTPFNATDGPDNLSADQFPASMGLATNQTNRSLRFMEMNDGVQTLDRDAILAQKFDTRYSQDSDYVAIINKVLQLDLSDKPVLAAAQAHLQAWDLNTDIDNPHAALAIVLLRQIIRGESPDDHSDAALVSALSDAVTYMNKHFDGYQVPWGTVNRLVRGDTDVPISGGPDILRAIYSIGYTPDEKPKATHGDTWIALVEWNANGLLDANLIHQFGSATSDTRSPHFDDQAPLFASEQWRKAEFDKATLRAQAERIYRPQDFSVQ
ncbi:penicillin acylase family protein [Arenicella xantha]|uniref:Penicillin amidase/acyl-homoserine-lactone acylase n=1 Tax=Arenicella xantha TaxID=644221 RepID=A0A395JMQ6_9GAMM|nr:penicillin acylase family protein [Arenicella xantha]RBP52829.1 penicillin amidase/acyl-homoserine-lactone acylase [Arenicella xantha]